MGGDESDSDGLGGWRGGGGKIGEERLVGGGASAGAGGGAGVGGGVRVVAGVERAVHGAAAGLEAGLAGHLDGDPAEHHRRDRDHRRHHRPHREGFPLDLCADGGSGGVSTGAANQSQRDKEAVAVVPAW